MGARIDARSVSWRIGGAPGPLWIRPYSVIGLTKTMLTIIKSFTVYNLTTVYGHRKGNFLNMLPVNMDM